MEVTYVTDESTLQRFRDWNPTEVVAYDTETTGLEIYSGNFRMRLLQLGDAEQAWVFPETHPAYVKEAYDFLLRTNLPLTAHNASFDIAVLDRAFGYGWDGLFDRTIDTGILAHLRSPLGSHKLKDVVREWVPDAKDSWEELMKVFMKELGLTAEEARKTAKGWELIPIDHPTYVHYAGYDTILSAIAFRELSKLVTGSLVGFEHAVQRVTAGMQRRGFYVDTERAESVGRELEARQTKGLEVASMFGIQNVNSTAQVAEAFLAQGAHLVEKTKGGKWKVDKAVLRSLSDIHAGGPIADLAQAVTDAKQAGNWKTKYVDEVLLHLDPKGRVHPNINSLQARTARMSVDHPAFHQLPSGDSLIRSIFGGPEGDLFFSVDYAQVEMRILAVLANERDMIHAIASGLDLHSATAEKMFGPDFTKKQRGMAKSTGFGKVYGGGATTIARQTGATIKEAKTAVKLYDRTYPGVKRYARYEQDLARLNNMTVTSPSGRVMPLDRDRIYAVTNYIVQSTARDILAQALINLEQANLDSYLILPIHDEVVGSAPVCDAVEIATLVAEAMSMPFGPLQLETEAEIAVDRYWGSLYAQGGTLMTVNR